MSSDNMRFIVDVGVGKKVEGWLREAGFDVVSVRDINPRASDSDILKLAVEECRIVLTMDKFWRVGLPAGKDSCGRFDPAP